MEEPVASISAESVSEEIPATSEQEVRPKLSKAEKKALYKITYPEPIHTRRYLLKEIFTADSESKEEKEELITSIAFEIAEEKDTDPFLSFLELYPTIHDAATAKAKSLAGIYVQAFASWITKHPESEELREKFLTDNIKAKALDVFTRKHVVHFPLAKDVFRIEKSGDVVLQERVNNFTHQKKFKEALDLAILYDMVNEYPITEFIIPCILQDKLKVVEKCLIDTKNISAQRNVVRYLDNFVNLSLDQVCARLEVFRSCMTINPDRLSGKTLNKTIKALLDSFGLNDDALKYAPRYSRCKSESQIRYYIRSRFSGDNVHLLSDSGYTGHIKDQLSRADSSIKEQLEDFLVNQLVNDNLMEDAARWAHYLGMSSYRISLKLQQYIREHREEVEAAAAAINAAEVFTEEDRYIRPGCEIVYIDSWEKVSEMLPILRATDVIAIDTEWKPPCVAIRDEVALLQAAVRDRVFLVDFYLLEKKLTSEQWTELFDAFLKGEAMKLGFDIANDLRAMFASQFTNPHLITETECKNTVCLLRLAKNICLEDPSFLEVAKTKNSATESTSEDSISGDEIHFKLSDLSEKILGQRMDKSEQCSNWILRPLAKSQIKYAALDAVILIDLFDELKRRIDPEMFDRYVESSNVNVPKREKIKKIRERVDDMEWSEIVKRLNEKVVGDNTNPRKPDDFKCIVDLMLLGLGKHLRRVGVDVLIPESKQDVPKWAKKTGRTVLSCGKSYEQLRSQGIQCFCITNATGMAPLDQVKHVLTYFNIDVTRNDVFSRCMDCNSKAFLRLPQPVIHALYTRHKLYSDSLFEDPFDHIGWIERLKNMDPEEYDGVSVEISVNEECPDWIYALCKEGNLDISRNMVFHNDFLDGIETNIKDVKESVVTQGNKLFYVCGGCGKIYWDGTHIENYEPAISCLMENQPPNPQEVSN